VSAEKYKNFVKSLQEATNYLKENPKESWEAFISYKPKELDNELNRLAWVDTLPYLAQNPATFDKEVYNKMATFMKQNKLITTLPNLKEYAQELLK
jgi:putative hydroxymethylpyrimidine transport system substrate-binding protein